MALTRRSAATQGRSGIALCQIIHQSGQRVPISPEIARAPIDAVDYDRHGLRLAFRRSDCTAAQFNLCDPLESFYSSVWFLASQLLDRACGQSFS